MNTPTPNTAVIAARALELVPDGAALGLGSGRASVSFVKALGQRVHEGLRVRCVSSSRAIAELATQLGIPVLDLEGLMPLDLYVDGADEVDPQLDLIKGLGGALVREKILVAAARRFVVLVDANKVVKVLGDHHVLPVEVVPFGLPLCRVRLRDLGLTPNLRQAGDKPFVSDNGNYILDCTVAPIANPADLEQKILAIPGVVGTGLFIGMAHTVLVQEGETVHVQQRSVL